MAEIRKVRPGLVVPETEEPPWNYSLTQVGVPLHGSSRYLRRYLRGSLSNRLKMLALKLTRSSSWSLPPQVEQFAGLEVAHGPVGRWVVAGPPGPVAREARVLATVLAAQPQGRSAQRAGAVAGRVQRRVESKVVFRANVGICLAGGRWLKSRADSSKVSEGLRARSLLTARRDAGCRVVRTDLRDLLS